MTIRRFFLFSAFLMVGTLLSAASIPFTFTCSTKIIRNGCTVYENRAHTYVFTAEVISDSRGVLSESWKWGHAFINAGHDERYAVRLHNPLPVRVAVNLAIDGLNSITGKPVRPAKGRKWIIESHSYITIRGWQVSNGDARRFFFTSRGESYAAWSSNAWGRDLSVNCGVIGAAYFWSKREMKRYFSRHPIIENSWAHDEISSLRAPGISSEKMRTLGEARQKAGTGMGERETHPVVRVRFNYDTGMYKTRKALIIYYDFPMTEPAPPRPFEEWAPQMPDCR